MINKVYIRNFQSHTKTILNFSKGLNVIAGSSDNGKTAIIRALAWVITNKPSGDAYRSWKGGDTRVTITLDNNIKVTRKKGAGINIYKMKNTFKAFGTGVPSEIIKTLNLGEINIQYQYDKFFLVSASPGEVARILNKIVNLELIDTSLSFVQKKIREESAYISSITNELKTLQEEATTLDWLSGVNKDLKKAEKLEQTINKNKIMVEEIPFTLRNIKECEYNIQRYKNIAQYENKCNAMIKLHNNTVIQKDEVDSLINILNTARNCNHKIKQYTDIILNYGIKLDNVYNMRDSLKVIIDEYNAFNDIINNIIKHKDNSALCYNKINKLQAEFDKLMPDICPLCGKD